jgi:hypothetical protein
MIQVQTAKKIEVVYKNPIQEKVSSANAMDLTNGKGFAALLSDASKANQKEIDAKTKATNVGKASFWDSVAKGYSKVKDSQGVDIAKNALKDIIAKRKAMGETPPPYVDDLAFDDKKKIGVWGWVGIGAGVLVVTGLIIYAVRKNK